MNNQSKDERVRQQILKAALDVFAKWGLNKTTMEDIAKAATKGKSTLYYYFKSKDEIFFELAILQFREMLNEAQNAIAQHTTAEDKLLAYVLCIIEGIQHRTTVYQVVFSELTDLESIFARIRKEFDEVEENLIAEILTKGVETGELVPLTSDQITEISHLMLLSFKAYLFEHAKRSNMDGAEQMFRLAVSLFMRGSKA